MKPVLTAKEMLAADSATIAEGTPSPILMERAARGVTEILLADFDTSGTVAVFCGMGNNGGDGFLTARLLAEHGIRVAVCYPGKVKGGDPCKADGTATGDATPGDPCKADGTATGDAAPCDPCKADGTATGDTTPGDPPSGDKAAPATAQSDTAPAQSDTTTRGEGASDPLVIDETAMSEGASDPFVIDETAMSEGAAREYRKLPPGIPIFFSPDFLKTGAAGRVSAAVDAMFGVGLSRPLGGRFATVVRALNESGIPVLALDIPTGICADSGAVLGCAVKAAQTVAISHFKRGHLLFPGAEYCGKLRVADIGVRAADPAFYLSEAEDLSALPPRPARSNKGSFGRVLLIAGSVGMSGAGYLAARAAYRAGAGLAELFTPARNRTIYQRQIPEAVLTLYPEKMPIGTARAAAFSRDLAAELSSSLSRASSVAIGMGLSTAPAARELTRLTLESTPESLPLVLDADALNILAGTPALLALLHGRSTRAILTPHPGEMSRLCGKPIGEILDDPVGSATAFAEKNGVILVLKDAHTVVTDGKTVYLNTEGNNGMATAGAGDVLAGVIAAFAAVCKDTLTAARLGVLAHAMAGDAAAAELGRRGVMASDIADGLCKVLKPIF